MIQFKTILEFHAKSVLSKVGITWSKPM